MLHLLKIEWLKVKNYKAFWVFTILYFFAILGINYTGYYINELASENLPAKPNASGNSLCISKSMANSRLDE